MQPAGSSSSLSRSVDRAVLVKTGRPSRVPSRKKATAHCCWSQRWRGKGGAGRTHILPTRAVSWRRRSQSCDVGRGRFLMLLILYLFVPRLMVELFVVLRLSFGFSSMSLFPDPSATVPQRWFCSGELCVRPPRLSFFFFFSFSHC